MSLLRKILIFKQIKILLLTGLLLLIGAPNSFALSDDRRPAELASRASRAIAEGNKNLAIYYYTQALLRDPSNTRWREWVAQAHFDRDDREDAMRHAQLVLKRKPSSSIAKNIVAKLNKPVTSESAAEDDLELADKAASTLPFPKKSSLKVPKGVAAWVVGNPMDQVKTINAYNQSAPKSQQIRVIFIECGKIAIAGKRLSLQFDPQPALQLAEVLIGDVWVFPLVGGFSRGASRVGMNEWDRMGKLLASKVEDERMLAGLYIEMTPLKGTLNPLFAATKKYTTKPVGAGGTQWDAIGFKYTDFMVLRAFGYSSDLKVQAGQLRSNVTAFLNDARLMEGKGFIGLPGAAAHAEYEEKRSSPDKKGLRTGKTMSAYFSTGLAWTRRALIDRDPAFMGIALWAMYSGNGVHTEYDTHWYFPSKLDPEILEKLKLPVERDK